MSAMSAGLPIASPSVFETVRAHVREFVAHHTLTPDQRAEKLAGYAPTAVLGTAHGHSR
ncbi:hypothetical protein AB0N05_14090 [Nocardia sp. NPDC051030]|uniref:hypothetical protein n=1 Tax=Nocardia sp. NPDC051030 TaxID=3155162 RepID=UPI0034358538